MSTGLPMRCYAYFAFLYLNNLRTSTIWYQYVRSWKNLLNLSNSWKASPDGWAVWGVVVSTRWWLLVDHCVLRNWDRILVRAVKGLISRAGMVSIYVNYCDEETLNSNKPIVEIDLHDQVHRCSCHLINVFLMLAAALSLPNTQLSITLLSCVYL